MPIIEYLCRECKNEFRKLRAMNDERPVICPECGQQRVSQLLSVTAQQVAHEAMPVPSCASGACGAQCVSGGGCCGMSD